MFSRFVFLLTVLAGFNSFAHENSFSFLVSFNNQPIEATIINASTSITLVDLSKSTNLCWVGDDIQTVFKKLAQNTWLATQSNSSATFSLDLLTQYLVAVDSDDADQLHVVIEVPNEGDANGPIHFEDTLKACTVAE